MEHGQKRKPQQSPLHKKKQLNKRIKNSIKGLLWWFSGWDSKLPMQKTQVWSLSREDPLKKGMTTHSNILSWRIPWTEEPGGLQSGGSQTVGCSWSQRTHIVNSYPGRVYHLCNYKEVSSLLPTPHRDWCFVWFTLIAFPMRVFPCTINKHNE